jgi:selenocysteine lyase/cysteine desulfurase
VTIRVDDPEATVERLADEGIVVRSIPDPEAVRASVHAFNTRADVDALLDALGA